jgi:molybdopterin molybdotransferase
VAVGDALGRVLAEDLASRVTQPPVAVSAMDGYAVRQADIATLPARLKIAGAAPAGGEIPPPVRAGEALRIFTGGPVPEGADTIVIQENTAREGDAVVVKEPSPAGKHIRAAGLDFRAGEVCLRAGRRLTSRDVGLAAAMDHPWVKVHRRPRIAILSTGDELALPGERRRPTDIVSSNGFALAAFCRALGALPTDLGIGRDDRAALDGLIAAAEGADMLVTSGGASVGEHDLVQEALKARGMALDFWKIAMRPGKPLMFGMLGRTAVLGLPGNPVSSLVCATLFLRPAIERLLGLPEADPTEPARLGVELPANDSREDYLRARLERNGSGEWVATPFSKQDSSMMSLLTAADCLVVRPVGAPATARGEIVRILRLSGGALGI